MPKSDRDTGDPSYRIKSVDEKHERVVLESDLTSSAWAGAGVSDTSAAAAQTATMRAARAIGASVPAPAHRPPQRRAAASA